MSQPGSGQREAKGGTAVQKHLLVFPQKLISEDRTFRKGELIIIIRNIFVVDNFNRA